MLERDFQAKVIKEVKRALPGCVVLKTDPGYLQGIPDLLILYEDKWAALEVKNKRTAPHRPNQDYYVSRLGDMSFARFIYPENEKEILHELYEKIGTGRATRISEPE